MASKASARSLLVCVDHSDYSQIVVRQARHLAKQLKLPLTFLHVFEVPMAKRWKLDVNRRELIRFHLEQIRRGYRLKPSEDSEVRQGRPYEEILKVARKLRCPLIITGHRGQQSGVSRLFLGSTAERVALLTRIPLWICRGDKIVNAKRILIPSDLGRRSKLVPDRLRKIGFKNYRGEYFYVHLPLTPLLDHAQWQTADREWQKVTELEIKRFSKAVAPMKVVSKRALDVAEAVKAYSRRFDLIAISPTAHRSTGFGSVTAKLIRSSQKSVLVIP